MNWLKKLFTKSPKGVPKYKNTPPPPQPKKPTREFHIEHYPRGEFFTIKVTDEYRVDKWVGVCGYDKDTTYYLTDKLGAKKWDTREQAVTAINPANEQIFGTGVISETITPKPLS